MESVQTEIGAQLHLAYMLAQALFLQRQRREALALYDLTLGWTTTEEGQLRPLPAEEHYNTHRIPAEFMILANQCFASFLEQRDVPALYRNHRARVIGAERSLLLQQMETALAHPEQQSFQQVRATTDLVLERASYAPTVLGHFGLNLPVYIHLQRIEASYRQTGVTRQVAVITPYNAQIEELKAKIQPTSSHWQAITIEIAAIDAFQGRDCDIVLYSTVRSNKQANLGFLRDRRRLNVALSRARQALLLVGDLWTLENGRESAGEENPYRRLIKHLRENSEDCAIEALEED